MTELKPCPFCGGPAEDLGDPDCNDFVRCTACDCYGPKGGAAAWNRLFDDTMSALHFDFEGESLTLEPLLGKLQDPDEKKREAAANALAATLGGTTRLPFITSDDRS